LYHDRVVRAAQIMAEGFGAGTCSLGIGSGHQVIDELAAQV
jgi:hypothetical protein